MEITPRPQPQLSPRSIEPVPMARRVTVSRMSNCTVECSGISTRSSAHAIPCPSLLAFYACEFRDEARTLLRWAAMKGTVALRAGSQQIESCAWPIASRRIATIGVVDGAVIRASPAPSCDGCLETPRIESVRQRRAAACSRFSVRCLQPRRSLVWSECRWTAVRTQPTARIRT